MLTLCINIAIKSCEPNVDLILSLKNLFFLMLRKIILKIEINLRRFFSDVRRIM